MMQNVLIIIASKIPIFHHCYRRLFCCPLLPTKLLCISQTKLTNQPEQAKEQYKFTFSETIFKYSGEAAPVKMYVYVDLFILNKMIYLHDILRNALGSLDPLNPLVWEKKTCFFSTKFSLKRKRP
jgi:hypothetical protein